MSSLAEVLVFSGINILILTKFVLFPESSLRSNLGMSVQGIGVSIRIDSMLLNCSSEHTLETALNS